MKRQPTPGLRPAVVIALAAMLSGCGGAGSQKPPTTALTGAFVDSAVANLGYRTETQHGVTGPSGEFTYLPGEHVTFFIGGLAFPTVAARPVVTPLTLAGTADVMDRRVVNMGRLLISLDVDGDPSNGIGIPAGADAVAAPVEFDVDPETFATATAVTALMARVGKPLVSPDEAIAHLQRSVGIVGTWTGRDLEDPSPTPDPRAEVLVLFVDGTFIFAEIGGVLPNGLEAGTYVYDAANQTMTFDVTFQHATDGGLGAGTTIGQAVLDGDQLTLRRTGTNAPPGLLLARQAVGAGIVGTWSGPDSEDASATPDARAEVLVLFDDGRFVFAERSGVPDNGVEAGTYVYDAARGEITVTRTFTDGTTGGVGPGTTTVPALLSGDGALLTVGPTLVLRRE